MRAVVIYKWARDPEDARVGADGSVDWHDAPPAVSDDDPAAARIARELAGADGDEIIGLTLGGGDASWALARGAGRAVVVADAEPCATSTATAAVLAAAVTRIGAAAVVVVGDPGWDSGVAASLAGLLGWPALVAVATAEMHGDRVRATRATPAGSQVVEVSCPVVLGVTARTAEEKPPGMKEILAARRRPLDEWRVDDLDVPATGTVTSTATEAPETAPPQLFDGSDPLHAATDLVAALRSEGVL